MKFPAAISLPTTLIAIEPQPVSRSHIYKRYASLNRNRAKWRNTNVCPSSRARIKFLSTSSPVSIQALYRRVEQINRAFNL